MFIDITDFTRARCRRGGGGGGTELARAVALFFSRPLFSSPRAGQLRKGDAAAVRTLRACAVRERGRSEPTAAQVRCDSESLPEK